VALGLREDAVARAQIAREHPDTARVPPRREQSAKDRRAKSGPSAPIVDVHEMDVHEIARASTVWYPPPTWPPLA
jgi:hypothetical protein